MHEDDDNLKFQTLPPRTEIGRQIREAFTPQGGQQLQNIDYSSTEMRILEQLASKGIISFGSKDSKPLVDNSHIRSRIDRLQAEMQAHMEEARIRSEGKQKGRSPLSSADRTARNEKTKAARKARRNNR